MLSIPKTRFVLSIIAISLSFPVLSEDLEKAIDQGVKRTEKAQQSQQKINTIDAEIKTLEREYRAVIKEIDGLNVYIEQLDKQLKGQEEEMIDIENSIRQVTLIERQITPLMLKMIDSLEQFVNVDVPFELETRKNRVASLQDMMGRSDVTVAEKFRKVMDAYQKEMDYGRTLKTYRGPLAIDGEEKEVDFLRVGRIALLYQSLDGEELGVWNTDTASWEPLESSYKSKLTMALRIAREQAAPDLIKVPLQSPKVY